MCFHLLSLLILIYHNIITDVNIKHWQPASTVYKKFWHVYAYTYTQILTHTYVELRVNRTQIQKSSSFIP